MKQKIYIICLLFSFSIAVKASEIKVLSFDKSLELRIQTENGISLKMFSNGAEIFQANNIRLVTDRGEIPSAGAKVSRVRQSSVNRVVKPEIKEKMAEIPEEYNEAIIEFKDKSKLIFRLYNNGMAYRFVTNLPGEITILDDKVDFIFDENATLVFQKDNNNPNSDYEKPYITTKINDLKINDMGNLPALVQNSSGGFILFMEADTKDYPCMWIKKTESGLSSHFWGYPASYNPKGGAKDRLRVTKSESYIARTRAFREFPWKVFAVADKETDLLTNQLVYLLGEECQIADPSWIKPGWVTFDWWSRRGIYGVDFKAGVNTETAKYMIDFAADFGIRYFLFDDGWTPGDDLTEVVPGLDMSEVVRYGRSKDVDVMLWVTFDHIDGQMEKALKKFSEWGIKGLKIDFINRSDQEAVNFYWRAAEECAKHQMVIDFHGAYRPDGLRRAYPNVLTREALIEFEYSGVSDYDNPDHHCTLPFIRNVAGPMDYIPGTMNNATKSDFRHNGNKPMGQGTRAHSLAMAVITESPMQMLSDAQPLYYRERECTEYLTQIPVEWDETIAIDGKLGDYVAMARRNGDTWYAAAITDWTPRTMEINLDFLKEGKVYTIEIFKDGINADTSANDYKKEVAEVRKGTKVKIAMAPGGGWSAKIKEKNN